MKTPIIINLATTEHKEPDPEQKKEDAIHTWAKTSAMIHQHFIDRTRDGLLLYDEDRYKEQRKAEQLCRYCFYMNKDTFSGQAFTTVYCHGCGKQMTFSNTDTDNFCSTCGKKYNVCKHCGAEMD